MGRKSKHSIQKCEAMKTLRNNQSYKLSEKVKNLVYAKNKLKTEDKLSKTERLQRSLRNAVKRLQNPYIKESNLTVNKQRY